MFAPNKDKKGFFLLQVAFVGPNFRIEAVALIDTGATDNFISKNVADQLCLDYHPGDYVKGGYSQLFLSYKMHDPLSFRI